MRPYVGSEWTKVTTACVMPSSAPSAFFGGVNVLVDAKAKTLAEHLARVGAQALIEQRADYAYSTRWLGASYEDGSVGGIWITERTRA